VTYNVSTSSVGNSRGEGWIAVTRTSDRVVIFNATGIQFSDMYLRTHVNVADAGNKPHVYGFGERVEPTFHLNYTNHTFTLFNADESAFRYNRQYGSHPFYTQILNDGSGSGHTVYLKNSNGMEVTFYDQRQLQYHVLGGVLDWYIFTGVCVFDCTVLYCTVLMITALQRM
jgi:alpha-glucosidase (family GH31 glycosyl hydrolase)